MKTRRVGSAVARLVRGGTPSGRRAAAAALSAWLVASAASAYAQTAPAPTASTTDAESPVALESYVVTATRSAEPPAQVAATTLRIDADTLQRLPALTVDDVLRTTSAFSLFRRTDSLIAHPTSQGVSLRGLGPSGASRSLVLLDGLPLNDPFGGWVSWAQIPREAIAGIEVVPGGGAPAWGNAALGGVVQVLTAPATTTPRGDLSVFGGEFATRGASLAASEPAGSATAQVFAEDFATDGFPVIAAGQRGAVDVAAWSRHRSLIARWTQPLGASLSLTATVRGFEELHGNGTRYQRNGSRAKLASISVAAKPSASFSWTAAAYGQDQSFASTFSSISNDRSTETPASDQYAVPATALGANWVGTLRRDRSVTAFGADVRSVHGETREHYAYANGAFLRGRVAGGSQSVGGVFATESLPLRPDLTLDVGARVDRWSEANGHRREGLLAATTLTRNDVYPDRSGTEFSPSAGLVWQPSSAWRWHVNAQQGYRRPTLNELYRPFRQGSNVVEANPALRTERATSGEVGGAWTVPAAATNAPRVTLAATAFWNDLHDAVSNITLAEGPGTFPVFGPLGSGAVGRQRLNLDRVVVQGAEFSATAHLDGFEVTASYLYDDATVRRAGITSVPSGLTLPTGLAGRTLAEVPRNSATLAATWNAPGRVRITPRVRWIGEQFDDDENTLVLGAVTVLDLGIQWSATPTLDVFANAENLTNARIETARSPDGIVSTGTPRFLYGGVRLRW